MAATMPAMIDEERPSRLAVTPGIELLVLGGAVAMALVTWWIIAGQRAPYSLIAPPLVAFLLVANLVPGVLLMMLLGRRIARRRAASSPVGGGGRLHVRLVAIFSTVAAVPMILVAIFASLLFQYGVQFWYSDRARNMLENTSVLAQASYDNMLQRWEEQTVTMASDTASFLQEQPIDSPSFSSFFFQQVYFRSLSDGALFSVSPKNGIQTYAILNPDQVDLTRQVTAKTMRALKSGQRSVVFVEGNLIQTVTPIPGSDDLFLYTARLADMKQTVLQTQRASAINASYRTLLAKSRSLQLQFNVALLLVSLLMVGVTVWIALAVADRLVRPVGELVDAARRVTGGDLSARVPDRRSADEVGTLAQAFNQMTGRLEEQNTDLLTANDQLENRRALIEAVMAGVSAGVVATGNDRTVRIANRSATELLGTDTHGIVGRPLRDIAPELDDLLDDGSVREAIAQLDRGAESRTLAVRIARTDTGPILTFDDITQQLLDQRRAAWSDVARRIAHEIKNPLTPIQLAAERLQRRYGGKVEAGDGVFARLTETIIRQVGDLRRMVDEFSSFARMPKPVFREESIIDILRQTMFLHEVAHPGIRFSLDHGDEMPILVGDRRQLGQAMTNIVKNAVEAVEASGREDGEIVIALYSSDPHCLVLDVADNGIGLPPERERIIEPYMTTRARGTGLGLAIVKKIVEEHHATIAFADRPGGGTIVTIAFDTAALARLNEGPEDGGPMDRSVEMGTDARRLEPIMHRTS